MLHQETARMNGSWPRIALRIGVDGVTFSCEAELLLLELVREGLMFAGVAKPADEEFGEDIGV